MVSRHLRQTVFRLTPGTPEHRALHWHSWDQVEFPETLEKPGVAASCIVCLPITAAVSAAQAPVMTLCWRQALPNV